LSKPYILILVLLLILLPTVIFFFWEESAGPKTVSVELISTPPGATIIVDGTAQDDKTDVKLDMPPGEYQLRLELKGYKPVEKTIVVKADTHEPFAFALEKLDGTGAGGSNTRLVWIKSTPPGATVILDDLDKADKTDASFTLPVGTHTLVLNKAGYAPLPVTLEVPAGTEPLVKEFTLIAALMPITIKTDPPGAKVYVEGKELKKLPDGSYEAPVGKYPVEIVLDKFHEKVKGVLDVVANKSGQEFKFTIPEILKTLTIRSEPTGADVFLDDVAAKDKTNGNYKIKPGKHTIAVKLDGYESFQRDIDVALADDPETIVATLVPLTTKQLALLVGVGRPTPALPDFLHAESDVKALAQTLIAGGFKKENVTVLTPSFGEAPTAVNIRSRLKQLAGQAKASDTLLVALVGHQVQLDGESYFCPPGAKLADKATLLPLIDVYKELANSKAQLKLLIADSWRHPWVKTPAAPMGVKLTRAEATLPPGLTLLACCQPGGEGFDHDDYRTSIFSYYLRRGLQGEADKDGDHRVSLEELVEYVSAKVPEFSLSKYGLQQKPDLVGSGGTPKAKLTVVSKGLEQLTQGRLHLEAKKYAEAQAALDQAAMELPTLVDVFNLRAELGYATKNYDAMLADVAKALALDPNNATACSYQGDALYKTALAHKNDTGAFQKQCEQALASYGKAVAQDPQYGPEYNSRGVVYFEMGQFDKAVKEYSEALRLNPKQTWPFENRGTAYLKLKDYDKAIADFTKALELKPTRAELYNLRGLAHRQKGDITAALDDYGNAIKLQPNNVIALFNRAVALAQMGGKSEQALEDLSKAVSINPKFKEAFFQRAKVYQADKRYEEAIKDFSKVTELDPGYALAWYEMGMCVDSGSKDLTTAISHYTKAIELKPEFREFWLSRGIAFYTDKKYDDAIKDFSKVMEFPAKTPPQHQMLIKAYEYRGFAYQAKGDPTHAKSDAQKAKELKAKAPG
jgi:tetratricopeptide (TPR) repeat protein